MHSRHTGTQKLTSAGSETSQLDLSWGAKMGPLAGPNAGLVGSRRVDPKVAQKGLLEQH